MKIKPELYFKNDIEWRNWLRDHHNTSDGVYLIFYKVESTQPSMRWEEAVKVALCYGWIDSTVKKLDEERRKQYFCPRKPKSVWSKVNKTYITNLIKNDLMHDSGLK
ncbi:YdeI/OmpD-associated family protein [Aquimarina sp. M1]